MICAKFQSDSSTEMDDKISVKDKYQIDLVCCDHYLNCSCVVYKFYDLVTQKILFAVISNAVIRSYH